MSDRPLPSSFEDHPQFQEETSLQKFRRRLKEEPLVPLGCAATCYALYRAYRSMKARDSVEMNRMFRARIYAQAFTLFALVGGGLYYQTERRQRREFDQAVEARKSQEKRDAWLRELEIRDKEDREWRERHAAIEAAAKEAGKRKAPVQKTEKDEKKSEQETEQKSDKKSEQDNTQGAFEEGDEKKKFRGVLDAVKDLVSGSK
ncbi:hypothetical protein PHISCL_04287 [Aspergillus sclerotialis]|uniref:HIG1 domain-containing protein n=1 Tax=Aspergillus sclerotialis TaxID=2070753 RepID=A0A3A3A229_9EURO|nr:hypothetical protein PHISCL_04287 [Aspergillus sclerotialis]